MIKDGAGAFLDKYQKDASEEEFLQLFNETLEPLEVGSYQANTPKMPTYYVVGSPRSGTTLVNQVLATHFNLGYVNQLIASMWCAPVSGLKLSLKLLPPNLSSDYISHYGRTSNITEPHEFGYFWSKHLRYENLQAPTSQDIANVDWSSLQRVIQNLSAAGGRPFLFKPLMLTWYLDELVQICPESYVFWVERDPAQTVMSILLMREKMTGSMSNWMSIKPPNYDDLVTEHPYKQVSEQVKSIREKLLSCYKKYPGNIVRIQYEQFCGDPQQCLNEIDQFMSGQGHAIERRTDCSPFELSEHDISDFPDSALLREVLEETFGT